MIRARGGSPLGVVLVALYLAVLTGVVTELGVSDRLRETFQPRGPDRPRAESGAPHLRPERSGRARTRAERRARARRERRARRQERESVVSGKPGAADDPLARVLRALKATLASAWQVVRPALFALALLGVASVSARAIARRHRIRSTRRWEIRLGREDIATPYQREKLHEAFHGQLAARWWARLALGQPALALETEHVANGTERFTFATTPGRVRALEGRLLATYPDVRLVLIRDSPPAGCVIRMKKRRLFVERIQTIKDDDQALSESVVSTMAAIGERAVVQFVLTPAPQVIHRLARRLLKRRERQLTRTERGDRSKTDIGVDSVVEDKELKGALETQHRSLFFTEIRIVAESREAARALAGVFAESRSENALVIREPRLRASLYRKRIQLAASNPLPSWWRGVLSTSELAALWSLPRQRARTARLVRSPVRRAPAPPAIARAPDCAIMRDERGPVGLHRSDRKLGLGFTGGQNVGKTSGIASTIAVDAQDRDACLIVVDPKHDLAELGLTLIPGDRKVWYMDLARPEVGLNPLAIDAPPGAVADVVVQALKEAHEPGAILSQSDEFLRNAALAVSAVEPNPTLWHMYELLSPRRRPYRLEIAGRLRSLDGMDAVARYWGTTFPERWMDSRTHMAGQLAAPLNKINRLLTTPSVDVALRHPFALDIAQVISNREVLIVNGALGEVGEKNAVVVLQILLQLLHQAMKQQQRLPPEQRVRVCLKIDEAHLVLTPSFATMLALHRAAGPLEVTAAWQYSAQIEDPAIRSGLKSLLRSRCMFSMGEVADAREQSELAMELYTDLIRPERDDRARTRFTPDDIVRLPPYTAINSWVANGTRQSAFVARTEPTEAMGDRGRRALHLKRQRSAGANWPEQLPAPIETRAESSDEGSDAPPPPERPTGDRLPQPEQLDAKDTPAPRAAADDRPQEAAATSGEPSAEASTEQDGEASRASLGPVLTGPATYLAVHHPGVLGLSWDPVETQEGAAEALEFRPRDGEILRALWRYELLLVSQIWQEWWPDNQLRSPQLRLKQLARAGWLQRFRPRVSGRHEGGYALTRAGFQAGQRHTGHDGPYIPEQARWKDRRPVDHGAVQHLLQVNAWVLAFRRLVAGRVIDWQGEHEARLELPTTVRDARRAPVALEDIRLDHYQQISDLQPGDFGRIWPDATITLDQRGESEQRDLMVELDRTDRPNRNFHKFRRYDALITAWWRTVPKYQHTGQPPAVVFVCTDEAHAHAFMDAADRQVTGRIADPSAPEASWPHPGRQAMFFAAERDIHEGSLRAWKLQPEPPESTGRLLHNPREVQLQEGADRPDRAIA